MFTLFQNKDFTHQMPCYTPSIYIKHYIMLYQCGLELEMEHPRILVVKNVTLKYKDFIRQLLCYIRRTYIKHYICCIDVVDLELEVNTCGCEPQLLAWMSWVSSEHCLWTIARLLTPWVIRAIHVCTQCKPRCRDSSLTWALLCQTTTLTIVVVYVEENFKHEP